MNRLMMSGSAMLMSWKVTAKEVQKVVDRLEIAPARDTELETKIVEGESLTVAAVQLPCRQYASLAEYIVDIHLLVADAVNRRAGLICFPALSGLLPLAFLPQFPAMLPQLQADPDTGLPNPESMGECLSFFADVAFDAFYHTMSQLAARHKVYLMAGSSLCFEQDELRHRALLFNDQGELAGTQDKIAPDSLERALGIEPAHEVKIFDTPAGPVSILIGSDADYFEPARVAKTLGARLLLHPTGFTREYTPMDTAGGLSLRVQENMVYGVQSAMAGPTGLGIRLHGPSTLFAPHGISVRRSGVLAQSSGRDEPDVIASLLEFGPLEQPRSPYFSDRNPGLMEQYLDRLY